MAAVVQQWLLCCGNIEAADLPKLNALRQLGFSEGTDCLFNLFVWVLCMGVVFIQLELAECRWLA